MIFFCTEEYCIERIKSGLLHTKSEIFYILGSSTALSIQSTVRNKFGNCAYCDEKGNIHFCDELDPDKITDYIIEKKQYAQEREYIYEQVCRIMQDIINSFYRELNNFEKTGKIIIFGGRNINVAFNERYKKAYILKASVHHKRIRMR